MKTYVAAGLVFAVAAVPLLPDHSQRDPAIVLQEHLAESTLTVDGYPASIIVAAGSNSRHVEGVLAADAVLRRGGFGQFTADAYIQRDDHS